jgi:vancomycin aglycone glucosyltransferase
VRVLLSTYGSRGDVEPMVALAVQLRAHGVEVRVCAPPDPEIAELLAGAGVPHVPFDRPWRSWARPSTPDERTRRVAEFIAAQYDTVLDAAEGCDALVATAMSQFVARSVAEQRGIVQRSAIFAPNVINDLDHQTWDALFGPAINSHRESIGLPAVEDVREFMFTDRPWLAADPTLGPWRKTPDIDVVQTGAWLLPDARPLPPELLAFLDDGPPPVYVGFGSMRGLPADVVEVAVEAIRGLGQRVLLARGWAGLAPVDDRDDCLSIGEVNQQALFRRVAAVVHHGGAGTTTTAGRAGAPQVVVPQAGGDQDYWAGRVVELGIGASHDGPAPTVETLSTALEKALTPETRTGATAVAPWILLNGATVATNLLLETGRGERSVAHLGDDCAATEGFLR